MYYKPTFEAFLATFNNLLRYICSSLSSWLFDILYQISELNTSLLMSTDSLETKAISKKNWPKLVRFNIDIIVDSSFTLIHSVLNVLFIRPNSAGMVSRGYETAKRLVVSGLWGEGDPKRPKKNLLSPETMRPKETQGESLESRDYVTVSKLPAPHKRESLESRDSGIVSGLKRFSLGLFGLHSLMTQEIHLGSLWVALSWDPPPS